METNLESRGVHSLKGEVTAEHNPGIGREYHFISQGWDYGCFRDDSMIELIPAFHTVMNIPDSDASFALVFQPMFLELSFCDEVEADSFLDEIIKSHKKLLSDA